MGNKVDGGGTNPVDLAAAQAAQDALILANMSGNLVGKGADYAAASALTFDAVNDWARVETATIGTGTAEAPQYPAGTYVWDGTQLVLFMADVVPTAVELASDITLQLRTFTAANNAGEPLDVQGDGYVLTRLTDNAAGSFSNYSQTSQAAIVGRRQYVRILWRPDATTKNYAAIRLTKSGTAIDTLLNIENGDVFERNGGQTHVVKNELLSSGLRETIIQYDTTVSGLTGWVVYPAYSTSASTTAQAGATGSFDVAALDFDYDYALPEKYHAVFSKEGPSGQTIASNVNGTPSTYTALKNASDNGSGGIDLTAGVNNSFNSHGITVESVSNCGDYIEIIKPATGQFHSEAVSISNESGRNAQTLQGDLRLFFAETGYTLNNRRGEVVSTGSVEQGTYRFTKANGGFIVTRDGVEIYREPCVPALSSNTSFDVQSALSNAFARNMVDLFAEANTPAGGFIDAVARLNSTVSAGGAGYSTVIDGVLTNGVTAATTVPAKTSYKMVRGINSANTPILVFDAVATSPALTDFLDAKTGTYWQSDYPPTHPSMLMMGQSYPTGDHPKLIAKNTANPSPNILINPVLGGGGTETFTVVAHTDFMRPTTDQAEIGVHVDDTTAVNGLSGSVTRNFRTNTAATGGAHRFSNGGTSSPSNINLTSVDTETAPNHRGVYQGIWGDFA